MPQPSRNEQLRPNVAVSQDDMLSETSTCCAPHLGKRLHAAEVLLKEGSRDQCKWRLQRNNDSL